MRKYLWDFTFEELFLLDEGRASLLTDICSNEGKRIKVLGQYFETRAAECRKKINTYSKFALLEHISEFLHYDMVLQLCLIYSLNIRENHIELEDLINMIESEVVDYFYEYRVFSSSYNFEKYSLMSQITTTSK